MNKAVVALGSNIDPDKNIADARRVLAQQFKVLGESTFIQTKPIGYADQADFINGSIYLETDLDKPSLQQRLKAIENEMGRTMSSIKFGPRSIDLDIVVWNGEIVDEDFYSRDFLKNAALELIPDLAY